MRLEIANDGTDGRNNLFNERRHFTCLYHKVSTALLGDLDESIAGRVGQRIHESTYISQQLLIKHLNLAYAFCNMKIIKYY